MDIKKYASNSDPKFGEVDGLNNKLIKWSCGIKSQWTTYAWGSNVVFHTRSSVVYIATLAKNKRGFFASYKTSSTKDLKPQ
jgi:hypothetical protein